MSETVSIATAADLFGKPATRRYKVLDPMPIRGLRVRIRSITEREYADYQTEVVATGGSGMRKDRLRDATRRFIALCIVDADGNLVVSQAQRVEMGDWDAADTAFLYDECARHCGINKGDIEDLVKNSEKTPAAS